MLRLVFVERGRYGVIRRYVDRRHGLVETVRTWREPEIVRLRRLKRRLGVEWLARLRGAQR